MSTMNLLLGSLISIINILRFAPAKNKSIPCFVRPNWDVHPNWSQNKYCSEKGSINEEYNPNGSIKNIAGIFYKEKNVLGMMPHPERMIDQSLSGEDGSLFFKNLLNNIK